MLAPQNFMSHLHWLEMHCDVTYFDLFCGEI